MSLEAIENLWNENEKLMRECESLKKENSILKIENCNMLRFIATMSKMDEGDIDGINIHNN